LKVTVCELNGRKDALKNGWDRLVEEIQDKESDLVILPEMPFSPWLMVTKEPDPKAWDDAVQIHEEAQTHLAQLGNATVLGTRPVSEGGKRYNRAFTWSAETGYTGVRDKTYLPDEEEVWEASWYHRGPVDFPSIQIGPARVGVQICTEIWFGEVSRQYGKQGAHIIASPRATGLESLDKWLACGRVLSIMSGAWNCSSNRVNRVGEFPNFGGMGWIVNPDGQVCATTSEAQPAVTLDLDLSLAESAKKTYPRYVEE